MICLVSGSTTAAFTVVEPTSIPIITGSVRRSGYSLVSSALDIKSPSGVQVRPYRPGTLGPRGGEVNLRRKEGAPLNGRVFAVRCIRLHLTSSSPRRDATVTDDDRGSAGPCTCLYYTLQFTPHPPAEWPLRTTKLAHTPVRGRRHPHSCFFERST